MKRSAETSARTALVSCLLLAVALFTSLFVVRSAYGAAPPAAASSSGGPVASPAPVAAASSAPEAGRVPTMRAERARTPPTIDGKISEDEWRGASISDRFTQKTPHAGSPPSERTRMRVLYDDAALYVAFECEQTRSAIVARLTRRDRPVEADSVTLSIDSRNDGKSAFEFSVNAAGVLLDGTRSDDIAFSSDWDETWDARVQRTPGGWSAEIAIPLRVLRFSSLPVQSWGIQARRYISMRQETSEWAFIPRDVGGEVSRYGKLEGLKSLQPKNGLEVKPFVVGRVRRSDADPEVTRKGFDASATAGIDLKWHVARDLTLDLAANPDFGQVEADQVVLNLTTYEIEFPEKRPFFLEGADTFTTPLHVLYTRRIGKAPDSPTLRETPEERLYDRPQPSTIYGAAKLVGALSDRWTVGTLAAVTANNHVDVVVEGSRDKRLADPLTSYNVLRLKRALGDKAHLGFFGTAALRLEPGSAPDLLTSRRYLQLGPAGQLCPAGQVVSAGARCFHDAYVAGVDGVWRSPSGDYAVSGQTLASAAVNGPPRTMPDGTVIRDGDIAPAARIALAKEGGRHWIGDVYYEGYARKVDYNDLGYMARQNSQEMNAYVEYRDLEPAGGILETHTWLLGSGKNNLDGLNLGRMAELGASIKFASHWTAQADVDYRAARYDDREVGDGTALQRAQTVGGQQRVSSDPRALVQAKLTVTEHVRAQGMEVSAEGELRVTPLPQLDIQFLPVALYTYGEPRFAGAGATNGELVFGKLTAKNFGATLRTTYTFSPRLSLQTYAQFFLASAHYSDFSSVPFSGTGARPAIDLASLRPTTNPLVNPDYEEASVNVNVVLRWEYIRGSTLYLVYARSQIPRLAMGMGEVADLTFRAIGRAPATDIVMLKMSYWFE